MFYLEDNFMEPEEMLGYSTIDGRDDYFLPIQLPETPEEPKVLIDERDTIATKCSSCHIMQENLRQCNSCQRHIPENATRTLIKSNGDVRNITGLNPIYSHLPQPSEPDDRVLYRDIENPLKSTKEVPVFFHHPDSTFRDSLKEIARSAIRKLKNNEDTIEEKMIKRCTFGKYWRYCSRCNPELWHVNKTDGRRQCTKDDLRNGLECIMDHMEFSEEEKEEPKETVQLENKMKNSMRPHYKAMCSDNDNYSSSEEQNADIIINEEKKKNDDGKARVASNKLSDIGAKKSQFMTPTKTFDTILEKKDSDSVQNVNMMKKQRKDANVTFMASNKLHSIDKSVQFMNSTKFAGLSRTKIQTSASSKKLNIKNVSQERPDMIKDTKLPYAKGKEGQFRNITKTASIPESKNCDPASSRKQNSVNIKKEREHLSYSMGKESQHMYTSKNVEKKPHCIMPHPIRQTFVQEVISKDVQKIIPKDVQKIIPKDVQKIIPKDVQKIIPKDVQKIIPKDVQKIIPKDVQKIISKDVQKIISKDDVSTLKNIQTSSKTSFDHKKTNLDTENLIPIENGNKSKSMLSSSEKFSKPSKNISFDLKEENQDAVNLNSTKHENTSAVMLSSSKTFPELSGNLASDHKETNLDTKRSVKNENENKITVIPSLPGKLSENTQKPLKLFEYPRLSQEDLKCLPDKNLLNDTIIEFYLKYIFNEKLTPELQEKTYICNPFFYPKVLVQLNDTDKNKAKSVETWLKGIDLFSKDFILIPVNVEFSLKVKHWYLVIICFLSKIEKKPVYGADSGGTQSMLQQKPSNSEVNVKRPCFCFFDSAYAEDNLGTKKLSVAKNLKNFLKKLWLSTHKYETCEWSQLISFNVKCPQQNNWYDCGIFLLQFAESFFQTPIANFEDPINVTHWFDQSMITEKRKEIKKIIVERMGRQ